MQTTTLSYESAPVGLARAVWRVVWLLWPVALLNYLDRQMLASMKYSVMHDVPSIGSEANWGFMLGQFKWVYAFLSPIGGYVADRFSRRFTICGSLFAWSAVTWMTGHVTTYEQLLATRAIMGAGRGPPQGSRIARARRTGGNPRIIIVRCDAYALLRARAPAPASR